MWVYCNGFLLRLRTHMYIRKINDSMHIQYGGTRKWVLLVELSTGRRVSLNISYVGVHHCSPRKTYVGVHTYLHTCAIYKSSIKTSVGVLWGSWERRYRQTNKHTWRYFLWGFGRDRTRRQTSHRRTCRRVFPIGNVLRKSVPRRTVIWTDDRVTTRFGSFSSLFLLRAAKKNIIIIFPSCSSQSQSQLLIAHSLLLDAIYIISTMWQSASAVKQVRI